MFVVSFLKGLDRDRDVLNFNVFHAVGSHFFVGAGEPAAKDSDLAVIRGFTRCSWGGHIPTQRTMKN